MATPEAVGRRLEWMALDKVRPADANPKQHALDEIKTSIQRFGFAESVLLDERTGKLVSGHGRLNALKLLRDAGAPVPSGIKVDGAEWLVPIVRGWASANDAEASALLVAVNRLTEKGGWDDAQLAKLLAGLREQDPLGGLSGTGYDDRALDALLKQTSPSLEVGITPEQALVSFVTGAIKQVVLYFEGKDFESIVARMEKARTELGCKDNTELFLALLQKHEDARS
jgi:hypothetical protein